jgi:hypothetical protein
VPEPLLKLAEIKAFKLFLTITYDPLLATAVNRARPDVQGGAAILTYSPNRFDDLPVDWAEWTRPAVYHLFGRASAAPEYAVTDGDILEFICAMQSQDGRPPRLFQKLQQSNLLLLGVGFPDWLTRFFLRVAKNRRLWETRERIEILAESHQRRSESLVCFCRQFSRETSIYEKDAVDFINELHARWKERDANTTAHEPIVAAAVDMQPGAVFISYASQDRPQAEQLKQALEANGLETWFDRKELQPGNYYEEKIRQNIRQCSLFLPVISNNACARGEGFFRKEWSWAVERLPEFFGTDRPFIMPVVIDNTPPNAAQLPEKFKDIHWLPAPGGQAVPEAVERLREALREIRKRERVNA